MNGNWILRSCLVIGCLVTRLIAFGDTPPQCSVEPEQDSQIRVSIPERMRSSSTHFQWRVEGIGMPEVSSVLTITRDPFIHGSFIVTAESASNVPLCKSTLNVKAAKVAHASFVDPYPELDSEERHRLAILRQVLTDEASLAQLRMEAYTLKSHNASLRSGIASEIEQATTTVEEIKDIDNDQQQFSVHLKSMATALKDQDSKLREACRAENRAPCSLLPRYSDIDSRIADLAEEASFLPPSPGPLAANKPPEIQLPLSPERPDRDAPLETLEALERNVQDQKAEYPKLKVQLLTQNNELQQLLDRVTSEVKEQKDWAEIRDREYSELRERAEKLQDASKEVSLEAQRSCGIEQTGACPLFVYRSRMDNDIVLPLIMIASATTSASTQSASSVQENEPEPTKVKVYFATEREQVQGATEFGDRRSKDSSLHFGIATVSIPPNHVIGEIEQPAWWKLEFHRDPRKHFTLSAAIVGKNAFYRSVSRYLNDYCPKNKRVFVFVHGYDVSFDEAIFRAAQITVDTKFDGAPIVYDWASWSSVANYVADKVSILSSVRGMEDFLNEVADQTGATTIDVIAHSMGNYGVLSALDNLARTNRLPRINQLILAAPDIDIVRMKQIVPELVATKKIGRITLYASSRDLALQASTKVNRVAPVGHVPPANVFSGIDTVDASAIEGTFLGHDYFATTRAVLTDIYLLLTNGNPPPRMGLKRVDENGRTYWRLEASAH